MNTKYKIVSRVQKTANGIRLYFFKDTRDLEQQTIETGVKACSLKKSTCVEVTYSDPESLYPIGIIGQACAACRSKPGNIEGGCRAYYIK